MKRNRKGFTLVELVIVIAVIAILAAVLLPTFSNVIESAKQSSATQNATNAFKAYYASDATFSTSDAFDTMADYENYIFIVSNGGGDADYKFVVGADGKLVMDAKKGTFTLPSPAAEVPATLTKQGDKGSLKNYGYEKVYVIPAATGKLAPTLDATTGTWAPKA